MAGSELTPMMRQYRRIKSELPEGVILLFRLGDFYELFFEDARVAAPIMGVALTQRGGTPMCGVPHHALDGYLAKLIRAGCKAAICDQVEDPAQATGIVRREVTRVVTPGTVTEDEILDSERNNFICAVHAGKRFGVALLDLSTGEFSVECSDDAAGLIEHLKRCAPSETLVAAEQIEDTRLREILQSGEAGVVTAIDSWSFEYDCAYDMLVRHFKVHSLEGYGCEGESELVCPAGALLHYVSGSLRHNVSHIRTMHLCQAASFLTLDESTCVNLDLIAARGKPREFSLQGVLNNTQTPMGARMLRNWVTRPLRDAAAINSRLDAIECLTKERMLLTDLRGLLGEVRDLERLIARVNAGRGNARDLKAVATSLIPVPQIAERMRQPCNQLFVTIADRMHALPELVELVGRAIDDTPPVAIKDGGIIRPGFHAELDELRGLASEGHAFLAKYQAAEQERTGIKTLKVRRNKILGFYIEVSKGQVAFVPPEYERRQTLVNAERYITPELKSYEQKIFGAQERSTALELELFCDIRDKMADKTAAIQETADALAQLDVLMSLADRALALGYVRPEITESDELDIRDGRHPVIEQIPGAEAFVANDTFLNCSNHQIMLITGPNMAGKSTYIRQVAIIAIMAHIGSFVPASKARIPLIDRVFTRVGAGDDLARGRSTFMVEMQETANILNNATERSLIVLDEIGRGTSTFDGISIAWAVAEYLHNQRRVKAKTLFATHYHELTDLVLTLKGVKNYTVQVREHGDSVVFLRRIAAGTADKSYGIHVARLAGMPSEVTARSSEILANLEEGELEAGLPKLAKHKRKKGADGSHGQMTLF
ncbi:MAG: DNA mismatch repair protein MutS [Kiritimatiellae bacterium]|nr:DNA mismatch repair protein MutS [Kiritimatiellia bacterium]